MVFASDLDRTLIYSSKFVDEEDAVTVVEYKKGKPLSFMSKKAKDMLESIRRKVVFIPVTTRTLKQFERIELFQGERLPDYAITSNGGTILINGERDEAWDQHIRREMTRNGYDLPYVYERLSPLFEVAWVEKVRKADDVFFYMVVDKDKADYEVLDEWGQILETMDWELIKHGKKMYCIPKCVNKRDALQYIVEKVGGEKLVASGDSRMDLTMEAISNHFIVPRHGELVSMDCVEENAHISITEHEGIRAAESVLETAKDVLL